MFTCINSNASCHGIILCITLPYWWRYCEHPHFLWFNLIHPDIWITIIAGVLYFIQAWVSSKQMPQEQRQMTYMMMIVSPIMIIWISLSSASALGLYWSVSAAFLVVQTYFANMYYEKVAQREVAPMIEKFKENNSNSNKKVKTLKSFLRIIKRKIN